MAKKPLTPKRMRFCQEYVIDLNGTQAAIRAGYKPDCANEQAARLLAIASVRSCIQKLLKQKNARLELTADRVLREWMILAFSNLNDYDIDQKTQKITIADDADREAVRAVQSKKIKKRVILRGDDLVEETESEIKLWDKVKALSVLSQHLGIVKPADLPPLETFLGCLPTPIADQLRAMLAAHVPAASHSTGTDDQSAKAKGR